MRTMRLWHQLLMHAVILGIGLFMLYPIFWLVSSSFKPPHLIFTDLSLWPKEVTLSHYQEGWKGIARVPFAQFFKNSFIISGLSVAGNIIACSMAAYAFARLDFTWKKFWFSIMLVTIMLPHHVTIIPQYILFREFNWIDTFYPLTVPKWLATDAFFIFLLVQFIRGLPRELDESAVMDGCGPVQIYLRLILPLSVPALITTAIFTFIWTWDDFFSQLLYINTAKLYTIPLGLRLFMDSSGESAWGVLFAMSSLSLIPSLLIFFLCQQYFVEGITTSGIKG